MTINSDLYLTADGPSDRPVLDVEQRGLGDWYRLYETADGWISVACVTDGERDRLRRLVGGRPMEESFKTATAEEWVARLDREGVPAEISRPTYAQDIFDDPEAIGEGWVVAYDHPEVGRLEQIGTLSSCPGPPAASPVRRRRSGSTPSRSSQSSATPPTRPWLSGRARWSTSRSERRAHPPICPLEMCA